MKLSRELTSKIHFFLDQCIPPIIRDSRWLIPLLFRLVYKEKAHILLEFKKKAFNMTSVEYSNIYKQVQSIQIERETDLTSDCIDAIVTHLVGKYVLDVGCGKGFLAGKMSDKYWVAALDILIDRKLRNKYPAVYFVEGNIGRLPFNDKQFDTVVCTHTLEHVQNIVEALRELRRVARRRVIIVVPKQRPYEYTFDLHLHFFPYDHSLVAMMGSKSTYVCEEISGDLFYIEDDL